MRIFHPLEEKPRTVHIAGEKAHYLATVLRCAPGDDIVIFDGKGASYKALVKSVTKKEVVAEINASLKEDTESPLHIILLQGLLKGEKMDLVIQKTTELGVKEIVPLITERTQIRETKKVVRWRKIAEDAARQCGRSVIPIVREPVELGFFLRSAKDAGFRGKPSEPGSAGIRGLMFWEEKGLPLKEASRAISSSPDQLLIDSPLHLLIGPEGGFTKNEAHMAESRGFIITSLGRRILRTETASIAATAIAQYLFGDLG